MSTTITVTEAGGPDVLRPRQSDVAPPGPGEIRIAQTHVGVNYLDVYQRSGFYPVALPWVPGVEGTGIVEATGPEVKGIKLGQRVGYGLSPGSYASERNLPAWRAAPLPHDVPNDIAAAVMLKGWTAYMLLHQAHQVRPGDTIVVHAAAGGLGQILVQWATHLGAAVVGTVGDETKADLVRSLGARHVVVSSTYDVVEQVGELVGDTAISAVYDGVGRVSVPGSLKMLGPKGHLLVFGSASGPAEPVDVNALNARSLSVSNPSVATYVATPEDVRASSKAVFDALREGAFAARVGQTWPLRDAAAAHAALEGRTTTGSTVLTV